jgi:hypothetical protein
MAAGDWPPTWWGNCYVPYPQPPVFGPVVSVPWTPDPRVDELETRLAAAEKRIADLERKRRRPRGGGPL